MPNGSLMPFISLCSDCAHVAELYRDGKWTGPPYCSTHYLALVLAGSQDEATMDQLVSEVRARRRLLRTLGPSRPDAVLA